MATISQLMQVDVLGEDLPVPMPALVLRRDRVVGSDDHGDRCGQPDRRRGVEAVCEIAVGRHAVMPVGSANVTGALRVQFAELAVAAVGG